MIFNLKLDYGFLNKFLDKLNKCLNQVSYKSFIYIPKQVIGKPVLKY